MTNLRESFELFPRHRVPEAPPQQNNPDISPVIDPAIGEKKTEIERDCIEYLQNPDKNTAIDFLNFTSNMIALIGGRRRKSESSEVIFTSSDPLLDQETQASIVFTVRKLDLTKSNIATITIQAQFADRLEQLLTTYSNLPSLIYTMSAKYSETPLELDSYITGKKEPVLLGIEKNLDPNEAKDFVRRVFDVYTRQGQQVQPPTPQS